VVISPGSNQVLRMFTAHGGLADVIAAGVRILECSCGPCIGMGQAPPSGAVCVRTFNRNFEGRSGTKDARIYLASPEVAAATALAGVIADPRSLGTPPEVEWPAEFIVDDNLIIPPAAEPEKIEVIRGPNIQPLPVKGRMPEVIRAEVLLKVGDNITTDHIMPAGAKILPLRSNIPAISAYVFAGVDPTFAERARKSQGGIIVGGANYGQGSSREHAALAPMYLGVKAVLAKSFARIHLANLINFGILPLTLVHEADFDRLEQGDLLEVAVSDLRGKLVVKNVTRGVEIPVRHNLTDREISMLKAGGALAVAKGN